MTEEKELKCEICGSTKDVTEQSLNGRKIGPTVCLECYMKEDDARNNWMDEEEEYEYE